MFNTFKNWFIPCSSNNYEPHVMRAWPIALVLLVSLGFFLGAQMAQYSLTKSGSYLAAVVSSVLVDLTNFDRASEGLHGLSVNDTLVQAAQLKANDMAQKEYFAHNSPDGQTPWYWFKEAGYQFSYAGENLAVFFGDSEDVEQAWMNSPAHRANILNSNFTEIGIATAEGYYQGQKTVFVVQMFGTPSARAPIATVQSQVIPSGSPEVPEGEVSGESIEIVTSDNSTPVVEAVVEEPDGTTLEVIHQDETFVAVKSDLPSVPSTQSVAMQSTLLERLVASPQTALTFVYGIFAGIGVLALVLLIFIEMRVQKPRNIFLGFLVLGAIGALFYFSQTDVVVASVDLLSQAAKFSS